MAARRVAEAQGRARRSSHPRDQQADENPETAALRRQVERLRELGILALLLHSAGTSTEILTLFLDKAPQISGAKVVYPLLLDRRRGVLHAKPLEGTNDARLDQASLAFEAEMTQLEFPLYLRSTRRIILEVGRSRRCAVRARPGGGRAGSPELRERTEAPGRQEAGDGAAGDERRADRAW